MYKPISSYGKAENVTALIKSDLSSYLWLTDDQVKPISIQLQANSPDSIELKRALLTRQHRLQAAQQQIETLKKC